MRKLRSRLTYANVMSTLAVVLVVAGGTAYAANTIGSSDIIDESILSQDIKNGEVKTADLGNSAVKTARIADGEVTAADIGQGAVATDEIAFGAVTGLEVLNDSLTENDIFRVQSIRGSDMIRVDDPVGGGATVAPLFSVGDFSVDGRCTDGGSGAVTAQVTVQLDSATNFAATSNAPGGQTDTSTISAVQLASFGPTTFENLGSGTYTVVASTEPLLSGVLALGTHVLNRDCVFGANVLG